MHLEGQKIDPDDVGNASPAKQLEELQQFQNFKAIKEVATTAGRCCQSFTTDILQYRVPKYVKIPKI